MTTAPEPAEHAEHAASAEPSPALACPSCGAPVWPGDNFCEACRAELAPVLVSGEDSQGASECPYCQGSAVGPEGYCDSCGRKVPSAADHSELDLGRLAGVTDRGLRHSRNEDSMALAAAQTSDGQVALAVVCDGVSTSSRADEASHEAVEAAMRVLLSAVRIGDDLSIASRHAFDAAQRVVTAMAGAGELLHGSAPSATFVSAVVTDHAVTVCWLGDSRAYWLDARDTTESKQLTSDDSVAQELVSRGLLSATEALASPAGHVVTGWIGADMGEAEPHVYVFEPPGPGAVLLCSDGLWNYQPEPADLAAMALPAALTDPLATAGALVRFALDAGGSDNITAVLAAFSPRAESPAGLVGSEPPTRELYQVDGQVHGTGTEPPTNPMDPMDPTDPLS